MYLSKKRLRQKQVGNSGQTPPLLHETGTCPGAIKFLPVGLRLESVRSDKKESSLIPVRSDGVED